MLNGGDTVKLQELRNGLRLGEGLSGITGLLAAADASQSSPSAAAVAEDDYMHHEHDDGVEMMGFDADLPSSPTSQSPRSQIMTFSKSIYFATNY